MLKYPIARTKEGKKSFLLTSPIYVTSRLSSFHIIFIIQKILVHKTFIFIVFWKCYKTAIKCAHLWNCLLNFDQHPFWGFPKNIWKRNKENKDLFFVPLFWTLFFGSIVVFGFGFDIWGEILVGRNLIDLY